ncbi:MAG: hypothetical protein EAZ27_13560 [Cytophagales bacterium]|nr:MAG: hypothetical protein EAZ27_13560 [Cytophagales bacterium]
MENLTYESVLTLILETRQSIKESSELSIKEFEAKYEIERAEREKERAERIASSKEFDARLDKGFKKVQKQLSEFSDTLGRLAEEQVKADLSRKFQNWGIPVHAMTTHFVQQNDNLDFIYEVDILIYNTDYVVAIEVKNNLKKDDIDEHLVRMTKLQEFPLPATKGKIVLGGVAGMIIGNGLEKYAESTGFFVIKTSGDSIKIANNKKTFKPREWAVA